MANAGVNGVAEVAVPEVMAMDDTLDALLGENRALHLALTFTRSKVDAVGGLHHFRANYVQPAPPQPPQAAENRP